jgi:hypothetical protein
MVSNLQIFSENSRKSIIDISILRRGKTQDPWSDFFPQNCPMKSNSLKFVLAPTLKCASQTLILGVTFAGKDNSYMYFTFIVF